MAYQKRYEDSYLDEEDEEFIGNGLQDGDRLVLLIQKPNKTEKEIAFTKKITDRLTTWAKMPGSAGKEAVNGIIQAAEAYDELGQNEKAIEMWARLVDVSETLGNRDLYYTATERMANIE